MKKGDYTIFYRVSKPRKLTRAIASSPAEVKKLKVYKNAVSIAIWTDLAKIGLHRADTRFEQYSAYTILI